MPRCSIRYSTTPGSSWPGRVPIGRPSSAVKPIVLSTLLPLAQPAHRGAAAEMRDDHPAAGHVGRHVAQPLGDIFVGEAVEAVAAHALVVEVARQRVAVGVLGMPAVEGGVEAGHLRHGRVDLHCEPDRREIVRLVQRRQRCERGQPRQDGRIDAHRPVVVGTAVHDAVADRPQFEAAERSRASDAAPPWRREGPAGPPRRTSWSTSAAPSGPLALQARMHADTVDLAPAPVAPAGRRRWRRSGT